MKKEDEPAILFVTTFPPRECGIATFTKDLTDAFDRRLSPKIKSRILAINSNGINIYNYPKKVQLQISDNEINDYIETAKKINSMKNIKLVCIQHEFGLFGGDYGDNLLAFLEIIEKPIVITFHSVLPSPNEKLKKVVKAISEKVNEIIVMTPAAVKILQEDYQIETPIKIIPHGIPTTTLESQEREKKRLALQNKIILSSFGMISSGKGYEYVIEALPEVVKKFPNLQYLIIGETHPIVRKKEGEKYRNFLQEKVKSLGLEKNVKFYNKYVTLSEIIKYLKASDIYISSSLDPKQITSGTLAYAMGCGRTVISTPFLHAKDAVTSDKGMLVEFNNPESFEKAIVSLLEDKKARKQMEKNAYYQSRYMTWPNVAFAYTKVFQKYISIEDPVLTKLPYINISHLLRLTDNFGIIQFARQTTPDANSGYTLDDNARALLVCTMYHNKFREFKQLKLIKTYLDYIKYVQEEDGKLYNLVSKKKKINKSQWSADAHGRAIWALGYLISSPSIPIDLKRQAEEILLKALASSSEIRSPRSISFIINGLHFYNTEKKSAAINKNIKKLADFLISLYNSSNKNNWHWFENYLTYANSKLSESLLYAYDSTKEKKYLELGLSTLNFLISKTFRKDMFLPIGQRGWFFKDSERALFDQQPIEAAYTTQTLILAYKLTQEKKYKQKAINAFQWFTGKNSLNQVMYNETTGGCHDGLGENTINLNQGAESTLSYLMARLSLDEL